MITLKILTHNNGIVTITVPADTNTEQLAKELFEKYGEFIQL